MNSNIQEIYKNFYTGMYEFAYQNEILIQILFINILIHWSILIEDLPGTGKTTLSKALAKLIGYDFKRIQGTSDLTPQDILGGEFYDFKSKNIIIRKWVIFTQLLLIDEINRMNPKTQSAFLQAMEEKKVSIMWVEYELDSGFFVIATQNPIEHTWTFPLPEAQKDRFTSRVSIWFPEDALQLEIIKNNSYASLTEKLETLQPCITKEDIKYHRQKISEIQINDTLWRRFVSFFNHLKLSDDLLYPLSQRWISSFMQWCRAHAYLEGREYIIPEDGQKILESFLVHRLDIKGSEFQVIQDLYTKSFKSFHV